MFNVHDQREFASDHFYYSPRGCLVGNLVRRRYNISLLLLLVATCNAPKNKMTRVKHRVQGEREQKRDTAAGGASAVKQVFGVLSAMGSPAPPKSERELGLTARTRSGELVISIIYIRLLKPSLINCTRKRSVRTLRRP